MNKRKRDIQVKFYVDEKELEQINNVQPANATNHGKYISTFGCAYETAELEFELTAYIGARTSFSFFEWFLKELSGILFRY